MDPNLKDVAEKNFHCLFKYLKTLNYSVMVTKTNFKQVVKEANQGTRKKLSSKELHQKLKNLFKIIQKKDIKYLFYKEKVLRDVKLLPKFANDALKHDKENKIEDEELIIDSDDEAEDSDSGQFYTAMKNLEAHDQSETVIEDEELIIDSDDEADDSDSGQFYTAMKNLEAHDQSETVIEDEELIIDSDDEADDSDSGQFYTAMKNLEAHDQSETVEQNENRTPSDSDGQNDSFDPNQPSCSKGLINKPLRRTPLKKKSSRLETTNGKSASNKPLNPNQPSRGNDPVNEPLRRKLPSKKPSRLKPSNEESSSNTPIIVKSENVTPSDSDVLEDSFEPNQPSRGNDPVNEPLRRKSPNKKPSRLKPSNEESSSNTPIIDFSEALFFAAIKKLKPHKQPESVVNNESVIPSDSDGLEDSFDPNQPSCSKYPVNKPLRNTPPKKKTSRLKPSNEKSSSNTPLNFQQKCNTIRDEFDTLVAAGSSQCEPNQINVGGEDVFDRLVALGNELKRRTIYRENCYVTTSEEDVPSRNSAETVLKDPLQMQHVAVENPVTTNEPTPNIQVENNPETINDVQGTDVIDRSGCGRIDDDVEIIGVVRPVAVDTVLSLRHKRRNSDSASVDLGHKLPPRRKRKTKKRVSHPIRQKISDFTSDDENDEEFLEEPVPSRLSLNQSERFDDVQNENLYYGDVSINSHNQDVNDDIEMQSNIHQDDIEINNEIEYILKIIPNDEFIRRLKTEMENAINTFYKDQIMVFANRSTVDLSNKNSNHKDATNIIDLTMAPVVIANETICEPIVKVTTDVQSGQQIQLSVNSRVDDRTSVQCQTDNISNPPVQESSCSNITGSVPSTHNNEKRKEINSSNINNNTKRNAIDNISSDISTVRNRMCITHPIERIEISYIPQISNIEILRSDDNNHNMNNAVAVEVEVVTTAADVQSDDVIPSGDVVSSETVVTGQQNSNTEQEETFPPPTLTSSLSMRRVDKPNKHIENQNKDIILMDVPDAETEVEVQTSESVTEFINQDLQINVQENVLQEGRSILQESVISNSEELLDNLTSAQNNNVQQELNDSNCDDHCVSLSTPPDSILIKDNEVNQNIVHNKDTPAETNTDEIGRSLSNPSLPQMGDEISERLWVPVSESETEIDHFNKVVNELHLSQASNESDMQIFEEPISCVELSSDDEMCSGHREIIKREPNPEDSNEIIIGSEIEVSDTIVMNSENATINEQQSNMEEKNEVLGPQEHQSITSNIHNDNNDSNSNNNNQTVLENILLKDEIMVPMMETEITVITSASGIDDENSVPIEKQNIEHSINVHQSSDDSCSSEYSNLTVIEANTKDIVSQINAVDTDILIIHASESLFDNNSEIIPPNPCEISPQITKPHDDVSKMIQPNEQVFRTPIKVFSSCPPAKKIVQNNFKYLPYIQFKRIIYKGQQSQNLFGIFNKFDESAMEIILNFRANNVYFIQFNGTALQLLLQINQTELETIWEILKLIKTYSYDLFDKHKIESPTVLHKILNTLFKTIPINSKLYFCDDNSNRQPVLKLYTSAKMILNPNLRKAIRPNILKSIKCHVARCQKR